MISDNPPVYDYWGGSKSILPADEKAFDAVQKTGKIEYHTFKKKDLPLSSL